MPMRSFRDAVAKVVESGNCSGCGACTMISSQVSMSLSAEGYMRPWVGDAADDQPGMLALFNQACPGRRVVAPKPESQVATTHPTFGRTEGAWQAWASDEEIRHRGSSGGAITAMTIWFLEQNPGATASAVSASPLTPVLSAPVHFTNRTQALESAGSRYAPASALAGLTAGTMPAVVSAKPCEASALRQWSEATGSQAPFIFSFFCAGTPSQSATNRVLEDFGLAKQKVTELRYRGLGWPGSFIASNGTRTVKLPAEQSWSDYFGPAVQSRCKICVDGTGEAADVSVGDFWLRDQNGATLYAEAPGRSVVIARSARGREFVEGAIRSGVLVATPISLDLLTPVQLHQQERREMLMARLVGRLATGGRVPSFQGYGLWRRILRRPVHALRVFAGSLARGSGREKSASSLEVADHD